MLRETPAEAVDPLLDKRARLQARRPSIPPTDPPEFNEHLRQADYAGTLSVRVAANETSLFGFLWIAWAPK
jgi:hypothetical protein